MLEKATSERRDKSKERQSHWILLWFTAAVHHNKSNDKEVLC